MVRFDNIILGIRHGVQSICIRFLELSFNHIPTFVELEKHLQLDRPKIIVGSTKTGLNIGFNVLVVAIFVIEQNRAPLLGH